MGLLTWFRGTPSAPEVKAAPAPVETKAASLPTSISTTALNMLRERMGIDLASITNKAPTTDRKRITMVEEHPVAYWCVRRIASAVGSVPWVAVDDNGQPDPYAPISQMLANPSSRMSGADFFGSVASSLATTGNAYILPVLSEVDPDRPAGIHFLRPDLVGVETETRDSTVPKRYTYYAGGTTRTFAPEEIIHVRHTWVGADVLGRATIDSVWEPADIYRGFVKLARKILENSGGIPGALVFGSEKGLSDVQRKDLQQHISQFRLDGDKFGQLLLLDAPADGEVKFIPLAGDIKAMQPTETKVDMAREVCLAFGVPPLLYTSDGPTYSNYGTALRSFWQDTVIPNYLSPIASALSMRFGTEIIADTSEVAALSRINTEEASLVPALLPVLTINEIRERLGYPPVPMGNRVIGNPGMMGLDTALAASDARTVLELPPQLLQGILDADAQSQAVMAKMLRMLQSGTSPEDVAQHLTLVKTAGRKH